MVDSDGSDVARTLSAKVSARLPTALLRSDCIAAAGLAASVLLAAAAVLSALPAEKGGSRAVTVAIGSIGYHVLPEFVADLRTSRSRSHYLQLAAVLEVPEEALARLQAEETRILSDGRPGCESCSARISRARRASNGFAAPSPRSSTDISRRRGRGTSSSPSSWWTDTRSKEAAPRLAFRAETRHDAPGGRTTRRAAGDRNAAGAGRGGSDLMHEARRCARS